MVPEPGRRQPAEDREAELAHRRAAGAGQPVDRPESRGHPQRAREPRRLVVEPAPPVPVHVDFLKRDDVGTELLDDFGNVKQVAMACCDVPRHDPQGRRSLHGAIVEAVVRLGPPPGPAPRGLLP
jgi:hypothetical protein